VFVDSKHGRIFKELRNAGFDVHDIAELDFMPNFDENCLIIVDDSEEKNWNCKNAKIIKLSEYSLDKLKEFLGQISERCPICGSELTDDVCEYCGYQRKKIRR
jgi:hypothetical protein